jgi:hypothetical protein
MPAIEIDATPNPNSLKFSVAGVELTGAGLESYSSPAQAAGSALGAALFRLNGVVNVFIVPQFMTVTKRPDVDWDELVPQIESVLQAHLAGAGG